MTAISTGQTLLRRNAPQTAMRKQDMKTTMRGPKGTPIFIAGRVQPLKIRSRITATDLGLVDEPGGKACRTTDKHRAHYDVRNFSPLRVLKHHLESGKHDGDSTNRYTDAGQDDLDIAESGVDLLKLSKSRCCQEKTAKDDCKSNFDHGADFFDAKTFFAGGDFLHDVSPSDG